jgi:hypothetical protein
MLFISPSSLFSMMRLSVRSIRNTKDLNMILCYLICWELSVKFFEFQLPRLLINRYLQVESPPFLACLRSLVHLQWSRQWLTEWSLQSRALFRNPYHLWHVEWLPTYRLNHSKFPEQSAVCQVAGNSQSMDSCCAHLHHFPRCSKISSSPSSFDSLHWGLKEIIVGCEKWQSDCSERVDAWFNYRKWS